MRLYSLKTLRNGQYKDVDIDKTISANLWKLSILVVPGILAWISGYYIKDIRLLMGTVLLGFILWAIISIWLVRYFILCETYIERGNKRG